MKEELTSIVKILFSIYKGNLNHILSQQELRTIVDGLGLRLAVLVQQADNENAPVEIYELIEDAEHLDDEIKDQLK